jgi:hypothetical protein
MLLMIGHIMNLTEEEKMLLKLLKKPKPRK